MRIRTVRLSGGLKDRADGFFPGKLACFTVNASRVIDKANIRRLIANRVK